jgi:hypothetical protein
MIKNSNQIILLLGGGTDPSHDRRTHLSDPRCPGNPVKGSSVRSQQGFDPSQSQGSVQR